MKNTLDERIPILDVEHDCILSKQGDVTVVFRAELPEIFTLSNQEYEAFHQTWVKALKGLPKHSIFHKQDWFMDSKHASDFTQKEHSFLSHSSERFFNERPFLDHDCYIYITQKPKGRKPSSSLFSSLIRKNIVPEETLNPQFLQDFLDSTGQFKRIMEDSGFVRLHQLGQDELNSHARKQGLIERYFSLSSKQDPMLIADLSFENGLQVGNKRCQLYTLGDAADLPAYCGSRITYDRYSTDKTKFSIGFASALGQLLSCNHIYNQYIFIEDGQKTLQQLERKRLKLQALSAYSRANTMARNATNEFLNEAISQQRLPVKAHFNLLVWTQDPACVNELKNQVSAALAQLDAVAKLETLGAPQIFWAGIPGNAADFPMNDTFDTFTEQATCFLNLETGYQSSTSPIGLRLGDRLTGKPVHVDLSDEPMKRGICTNRNKFILGPSGSGKSFFTNHMVRSYYEQGTHVLLVDVGHSYKGLCELVGGYYFTYDEQHPICFNPFYIPEGESLDTEKKESIKTLLLALWKKGDEHFNRSEYVALSNALYRYYEKIKMAPKIAPGFNSFYEFLSQDFREILQSDKVKEKDFDLDNLLYVLQPYYRGGEFDFLLNATENLALIHKPFIVFELDTIKGAHVLAA